MQRNIRGLPGWAEFAIVVLGAFGYFIFGAGLSLMDPGTEPPISEGHLRFLLIYEPVVFVLLALFLRLRGWPVERLAMPPAALEALAGVGLAITVCFANTAVWTLLARVLPHIAHAATADDLVSPNIGLGTIIAASVVNPIFEEVFVSGYIITALQERTSFWTAVNASVAVRLLYHLYQGAFGVVTIIPTGLIFAFWFARTGSLWPLIIAHGVLDLFGLLWSTQ